MFVSEKDSSEAIIPVLRQSFNEDKGSSKQAIFITQDTCLVGAHWLTRSITKTRTVLAEQWLSIGLISGIQTVDGDMDGPMIHYLEDEKEMKSLIRAVLSAEKAFNSMQILERYSMENEAEIQEQIFDIWLNFVADQFNARVHVEQPFGQMIYLDEVIIAPNGELLPAPIVTQVSE